MKKPVIIWVSALVLLASATFLFAQTTTGSSLITEMKTAVRTFTLTADLNPGATGLQSAPLVGKRTGDMLSAGEYNRLLELVAQGGGGGWNTISLKIKRLTGVSETCTSVCLAESKSCVVGFTADHSFSVTGAAVLRWAMDCNQSVAAAVYSLECLCSSGGGTGGGGGGSGWVDVALTDTANFDATCEYRYSSGIWNVTTGWSWCGGWRYADQVSIDRLYNSQDRYVTEVFPNNKSFARTHVAQVTAEYPAGSCTLTQMQKRC